LSRRYHTAHIEDCNWKDISRHLPAEEDTDDTAARLYRHVAAPGTLAQMIEQRFAATLRVNPAYTTMVCHQCGSREEFDAARHLRHQCQSCGAAWDQDFNAARNLLASGQVVAETPGSLDVA
jgi:transposase